MRRTLGVLLFLAAAAHAGAQEPTLVVDIRLAEGVDVEALRSALEHDLGMPVTIGAQGAGAIVEASEHTIVVRVPRGDRPDLIRAVDGEGDVAQRTLRAALLVSNLVRDESSALLAMLTPTPEPPLVVVEATPPVVVVEPQPDASAQTEDPAPPAEPAPPAQPAPPEPAPPIEPLPEPPRYELVPVAFDLAPGVGVSSAFLGRDERVFAIGAVGAWTGMLSGASLSGVVDVVEGHARGWQLAGVVSIAGGSLAGAQTGGVLALTGGTVEGAQIGGVLDVAERLLGVQLAGVAAISSGPATGVQLAGVASVSGGPMEGAQLALVNVAGGGLAGAQIGIVNVASGPSAGAQVGIVNVASSRFRGLQLGVVNVSEDTDASIGIANVHTRGRFQVRAGADTSGMLSASAVYGGRITHSILTAGVNPFGARVTGAFGGGIGARIEAGDRVHVDLDALASVLLEDGELNLGQPSFLIEPRVVVGVSIVPRVVGVYAGLGYQWLVSNGAPPFTGPVLVTDFGGGGVRTTGWPTILGGVELL